MSTHDADHLREVRRIAVAAARAAGVPHSEVDDIASDAVLKVMHRPHDPARGRLTTYVYTLVRHLWIDRQTANHRRRGIERAAATERRAAPPSPLADLILAEHRAGCADLVRRALSALRSTDAAVLDLRLRGVPIGAVGGLTTLSPGVAKCTAYRSRVRAGKALAKQIADTAADLDRVRPSLRIDRRIPAA